MLKVALSHILKDKVSDVVFIQNKYHPFATFSN